MRKLGAPVSRLPSLDLLKGFDAAARHLSFTRGAEDLFLTQSALSRQIQTLEEQLGVALFERRHRELRLSSPTPSRKSGASNRRSRSPCRPISLSRRCG